MSISTLAEDKVDRNADKAAAQAQAQAAASGTAPGGAAPTPTPRAASEGDRKNNLSDALAAVAAYVPTEIIAAYTIILALGADDRRGPIPYSWFLGMLVFTPLFVWLVYAVRSKEDGHDFLSPRLWPWWESIAACVAFTVWSAALPMTAFARCEWYSPRLAALALILVSGLLPLIGRLATKPRSTS